MITYLDLKNRFSLEKNSFRTYSDLVYLIKMANFLHLNELIYYCLTMFTKKSKIKNKFKNSLVKNCPSHLKRGI